MKIKIPLMALVGLLLMCSVISCKKDDNKNNTGNPPALSLPLNCDFQTVSKSKAAVQNVNGIDFTYTISLPGGILRTDGSWVECLPAGTDSFGIGGVWQGAVVHGALIADLSKLPAINKVTVKVHNDLANVRTQMRVCDGSSTIGETNQYQQSGDITLSLDLGGKKASKLYLYSGSTVFYSVSFE